MDTLTFAFFITAFLFMCVLFSEGIILGNRKNNGTKTRVKSII